MRNKIDQLLHNQQAFTLVEAVIAIVIVGVIGVIMADILGRTFDNSQKTNLISNIQQNGQSALSTIDDAIRYSEFVCVGGIDTNNTAIPANQVMIPYSRPILVVFRDGRFIRFRIVPETTTANGFIVEDFPLQPTSGNTAAELCNDTTYTAVSPRRITNDAMLSLKRGTITLLTSPVNTQVSTQTIGTQNVSVSVAFSLGARFDALNTVENQIGQNNEIEFRSTAQFR